MIERMYESGRMGQVRTGPPKRASSPGSPAAQRSGPPGWPRGVPPPEVPGWQGAVVPWLLDQCPADYRRYAAWRRHPLVLAWLTARHVDAQILALREAYRGLRVDLAEAVAAEALTDVLELLAAEGARLVGVRRATGLVLEAMEGKRFIPRL